MQIGIAFADKEYPARAAFGIVIKALDEFSDQSRESWRTATTDTTDAVPLLDAAVQKYQVRSCHALLTVQGLLTLVYTSAAQWTSLLSESPRCLSLEISALHAEFQDTELS